MQPANVTVPRADLERQLADARRTVAEMEAKGAREGLDPPSFQLLSLSRKTVESLSATLAETPMIAPSNPGQEAYANFYAQSVTAPRGADDPRYSEARGIPGLGSTPRINPFADATPLPRRF
jgi:hypothetical protein